MRAWVFFLLIIILGLGYVEFFNRGNVIIHLSASRSVELPITALFLVSIASGGLMVLAVSGTIEIRNLFLSWRSSKIKKREEKIQELFTEATNAFLSRRTKKAMDLYRRLIDLNPNHINSLLRLGDLYRIERDYNEAIRLHKRARTLDEHGLETTLSLSADLDEAGRHEEAIYLLYGILKRDDSNPALLRRLRDIYIKTEQWEEAHDLQERILKENGKAQHEKFDGEASLLVGLKYEAGRRYFDKGNIDRARKYFREALKLNKKFLPSYIGLGEILINENNIDRAENLWEGAFKITGNIMLLHRLEDIYLEMDQPDRAIDIYKSAIKRDPNNQSLRFYLGRLYYRLEMIDEAFDLLLGLDTEGVRFPDLHKLLGSLYLRKDTLISAVEEFKKAIDYDRGVVDRFQCNACGLETAKWSGKCPECGLWDKLQANLVMKETLVDQSMPIQKNGL